VSELGADRPRSYRGGLMAQGKRAEEAVLRWLRGRPGVASVADVRDQEGFQRLDVDFVVTTTDGRSVLVEAKSDERLSQTPVILFEMLRVNHSAPPDRACVLGWSARTPASTLIYFSASQHRVFVTQTAALRKAFQRYTKDARDKVQLRWIATDAGKSTLAALLPWDAVKGCFEVHDLPQEGAHGNL